MITNSSLDLTIVQCFRRKLLEQILWFRLKYAVVWKADASCSANELFGACQVITAWTTKQYAEVRRILTGPENSISNNNTIGDIQHLLGPYDWQLATKDKPV